MIIVLRVLNDDGDELTAAIYDGEDFEEVAERAVTFTRKYLMSRGVKALNDNQTMRPATAKRPTPPAPAPDYQRTGG